MVLYNIQMYKFVFICSRVLFLHKKLIIHGEKCKVIFARILVNFMKLAGSYRDRRYLCILNLLYYSSKLTIIVQLYYKILFTLYL